MANSKADRCKVKCLGLLLFFSSVIVFSIMAMKIAFGDGEIDAVMGISCEPDTYEGYSCNAPI